MFRKDYRAILAGGMAAAAAVTALHLSSQDTTKLDSGAAVNAVALPGTMRDLGLSPQLLSGAVKPASAKNASYSVTTDFMRTALVSPKAAALSRTMLGGNISGKLMSSDGSHVVAECTSSISGKIGRLNPFSTVGSTTCTATIPGRIYSSEPYFKGKPHGIAKQYSNDGEILGTYTMRHGNGVDLWWQAYGKKRCLSEVRYYKDGQRHGFEWWITDPDLQNTQRGDQLKS